MTVRLENGEPARIGAYELLGRLGVGGMGDVFVGRSPGGRLVAVKVVRPELAADTGFRRRFADEVAAARKVGGFYTAQVVDADLAGTPPWLATAYIPGLSLQQAITEHGPLPATSTAMLGAGLAEGLAAVHTQDLVHRDLKPANVILAPDGPRLIDFGIARALDATSYTQTHTVLGTAAYMSPEQITAEYAIGPASDVFSFGCVLAFSATGRSPFGSGPPHAITHRIVHKEPDLDELVAVSDPLAELSARCLDKNPNQRPALASVLDELAALAREQDLGSQAQGGEQAGDQTQWLPSDLTETIARRATEVLHDPGMPRTSAIGQSGPTRHDDSDDATSGTGASAAPGPSMGTASGRDDGKPAVSSSTRPPVRAYVSAGISLTLLLFALPPLLSAEGREQLTDVLFASGPVTTILGSALGSISAFLNIRHLNRVLLPAVHRLDRTLSVPFSVAAGAIGFVTPVLAFDGMDAVILAVFAPSSIDADNAANVLLILSLVVAVVLQRKGSPGPDGSARRDGSGTVEGPWQG